MKKDIKKGESQNSVTLLNEFQETNYNEWLKLTNSSLNNNLNDYVNNLYENIKTKQIYFKDDTEYIESNNYIPTSELNNSNKWLLAQDIPLPLSTDLNDALIDNIEHGQNAISLKLDKASANGFNPENSIMEKVGFNGTSIFSSNDFDTVFKDINIENYPVYIKTNSNLTSISSVFFNYLLVNKKHISKINGGFHYDPLSVLAENHEFPYDYNTIFDEIVSLINWLHSKKCQFSVITINGNLYNEAGGNAVQELAFTMNELVLYLKELLNRGIHIDEAAKRIKLSFSIGPNFFIEISKLRAARILWAKIIRQFGGNKESQKVRIQSETCNWNKFKTDSHVNLLRNTCEALSAMLGGCDSINLQYFDKESGLPNEFSRRITRNTFLVLKEECDLSGITDIPGGSWYIENLTNELAKNAWVLFQKVEELGGFFIALDNGFIKEELEKVQNERLFNYTKKNDVFIGNNIYPNPNDGHHERSRMAKEATEIDYSKVFQQRHSTLKAHIEKRDNMKLSELLDSYNDVVNTHPQNGFEHALKAVKAGATLGEISKPYNVKFNATIKNPIKKMKLSEL
ncbi:MAG: acyl-CoA mutase large subunit family protein [Ignavibacteriae bacterium]|nr:acyl-CoA mutase large subunit family protein [Ignavibacteriota bacterium]